METLIGENILYAGIFSFLFLNYTLSSSSKPEKILVPNDSSFHCSKTGNGEGYLKGNSAIFPFL